MLKKTFAFFLIILSTALFLNCKPSKYADQKQLKSEQESIARAQKREIEFRQKRAQYIQEHGHPPIKGKPGTTLLQPPHEQ